MVPNLVQITHAAVTPATAITIVTSVRRPGIIIDLVATPRTICNSNRNTAVPHKDRRSPQKEDIPEHRETAGAQYEHPKFSTTFTALDT